MSMYRIYNGEVPITVGVPVYYTNGNEMFLGRVHRIVGEDVVVIRDGKREMVPLKFVTIAKRAHREMIV